MSIFGEFYLKISYSLETSRGPRSIRLLAMDIFSVKRLHLSENKLNRPINPGSWSPNGLFSSSVLNCACVLVARNEKLSSLIFFAIGNQQETERRFPLHKDFFTLHIYDWVCKIPIFIFVNIHKWCMVHQFWGAEEVSFLVRNFKNRGQHLRNLPIVFITTPLSSKFPICKNYNLKYEYEKAFLGRLSVS